MKFSELIFSVTTWAVKNFDVAAPHFGFAEEVGEYVHVKLKALQKIRGYDAQAKVVADSKDALADATIFLAHWCGIMNVKIELPKTFTDYRGANKEYALGRLYRAAGLLLDADKHTMSHSTLTNAATNALQELVDVAAYERWMLLTDCVLPVWEKVRQRDWRKFPKNGLTE